MSEKRFNKLQFCVACYILGALSKGLEDNPLVLIPIGIFIAINAYIALVESVE